MKPWVKYTAIGTALTLSVAVISGLLIFYVAFSDMCGNELAAEKESPESNYRAVIFQRDCGATTGFSTQISILGANEELDNESGNILTADGQPEENNFKMSWVSSNVLLIINTQGAKIFKQESLFEKVEIRYE